MPSTQELIAELQQAAPGWPTEGARGLLYNLNECHRFMMSQDTERNVVIDPTTGRPPVVATTNNTFQYDAPDDCRRVWKIGIDAYEIANSGWFYQYYNRNRVSSPLREFSFREHLYYMIPISATPALPPTVNGVARPATYTFVYNPTDVTVPANQPYHLFYFALPDDITSTTVQPQVEEQFHWMLIDGVLARIGKKEYGADDNYIYWRENIVKKYYNNEQNKGQTRTKHVRPRYVRSRRGYADH